MKSGGTMSAGQRSQGISLTPQTLALLPSGGLGYSTGSLSTEAVYERNRPVALFRVSVLGSLVS